MLQLRDYQSGAIQQLREGFAAGHRSQILVAPTGSGKTEIAIALLEAARKKGSRAAMLLDRIVLCDQTSKRLDKYDIDHGVLQSGHWRYRPQEPIQVCSAQTLEKRGSFPGLSLLIVDEVHQQRKQTIEFIKANPEVKVIGLTATPFTKGLGQVYTNIVSPVTTKDLVASGALVPLRVFIAKEIDMEGAKKVAGEWSQGEAETRGMKITGDVVAEWIKKTHEIYGKPMKTIVFAAGVNHAADLSKKFAEQGYNFIAISYKDDDQYKRDVIEDFSKPDTEINGLIATDILTKGFDCILEGSRVLTDKGYVPIDKLSIEDKIWDGTEFVSHGGAIYKGERNVITYAGLTATLDHLVKTREGWVEFGKCAEQKIAIVQTEYEGYAVQECSGYYRGNNQSRPKHELGNASGEMLGLRARILGGIFDFANSAMGRLQNLLCPSLAGPEMRGSKSTMQYAESQSLSKLRGQRSKVQFSVRQRGCNLDQDKSRNTGFGFENADRSHRQQWSLRSWKFKVGFKIAQLRQYQTRWMGSKDSQIPTRSSGNTLLGQDSKKSFFSWIYRRTNNPKVQQEVRQTKGRVWDILNSGPRNCFTCEGLLVHNCSDVHIAISARPFSKSLSSHVQQMGRVMRSHPSKQFAVWLDHAGNYLRFREDWDAVFEDGVHELDDGKEKAKKEKTEKEKEGSKCPKCGALWHGGDMCAHCGYVKQPKNLVSSVPGELSELSVMSRDNKQDFWSQMVYKKMYSGWSDGRAAHTYKDKFGVWPKGLVDTPKMPSLETEKFIKSRMIAFLKSKKRM